MNDTSATCCLAQSMDSDGEWTHLFLVSLYVSSLSLCPLSLSYCFNKEERKTRAMGDYRDTRIYMRYTYVHGVSDCVNALFKLEQSDRQEHGSFTDDFGNHTRELWMIWMPNLSPLLFCIPSKFSQA